MEKPVVDVNVLLADDTATGAKSLEFDNAVEHEHRWRRQAGQFMRSVLDEGASRVGKQFLLGKMRALKEFREKHHKRRCQMVKPPSMTDSDPVM